MTAFEFMRNSFQILVGVLCWGGTLLVIVLILALNFADKPNKGIFVVQDRGGAIGTDNMDIYMEDLGAALEFGRRDLEVYVLGE